MMVSEKKYNDFLDNNSYVRQLKNLEPTQGSSFMSVNYLGKECINFSSSDYLGLRQHPLLLERSKEFISRYGVGSGASRLVTGNLAVYEALETKLAKVLNKPAALIIGSGYQANVSVLEALLDADVLGQEPLVFCDKYVHNSMIAMTRHLTKLHRYSHNDLAHLKNLLNKYQDSDRPKFILTESIYSMEGDSANLSELIALANQHQAAIYVDDAHAVGVYGRKGWGMASDYAEHIPFIMGTFSKALGSYGAYIGCSTVVRDYLINKCKGLIYSTGLPPAILGAISGAIDLLPELQESRQKVKTNAQRLRDCFREIGLDFGQSSSHIVPWIIGDAQTTLKATTLLEEYGIIGTAIQPPSVPVGKARIRFCLSAAHTEQDLEYLMHTLKKVSASIINIRRW